MKKLILIILLLPLLACSQSNVKHIQTVKIVNTKTPFDTYLPIGTLVLDLSSNKIYALTKAVQPTETLSSSNAFTFLDPTGLELIAENGTEGWRLVGRDPYCFGNIGREAVDLSINDYPNTTHGATGKYSFASGNATVASGESSFASGVITNASGINSTATGKETTASGVSSFASGEATTASNYFSTAMGFSTIASGSTSFATGNETVASGNGSFTQGEQTTAQNTNQLSIGQYNLGTSSTTIFETGIGTGVENKNAFEIHTTGKVWVDHLEVAGHITTSNTGNSIFIGEFAGINDDLSDNRNVFIGRYSGYLNTTGNYNNALGYHTLTNNTTGQSNVAIGSSAMEDNETGTGNTAVGFSALYQNRTGDYNTAVGNSALGNGSTSSTGNVAVGYRALKTNQYSNNTAIGYKSGSENMYGTGCIFIGYQSGKNTSTSNILFIDNSDTAAPLIYGNFASDSLVINGDLTVTGKVTFPTGNVPSHHYDTGTQGQIIYGEDYIYICIQPDEWKRVAISDW